MFRLQYIYMLMSPKTNVSPKGKRISLFKPVQVVWRHSWKAQIVSTGSPIARRTRWAWHSYFVWCFSNPVTLWSIVADQVHCTSPYRSPDVHILASVNCTSYSIRSGPNHLCIMSAHGTKASHRTARVAILGVRKGIIFHFVIPWLDQLENRAISSSSYR